MKIQIMAEGSRAMVKPAGYIGGDAWQVYLNACRSAGSIYDPAKKAMMLEVSNIPSAIDQFHQAGFEPVLETKLADEIRGRAQEAQAAIASAQNRLEAVDAELQKRGLKLFPFQRTGVAWLASRRNAILADEMGLGKTIQTLTAIPHDSPVIAVCPASLKNAVWKRETEIWRPDLRPFVCSGRGSFRWPKAREISIINYDILPPSSEEVKEMNQGIAQVDLFGGAADCAEGTILLADEAHAFKSKKAMRTQRFITLAKRVIEKGGKVWLLTGTPLLNRPQELWTLLEVAGVAKEAFGGWTRFFKLMGGFKAGFGVEFTGKTSAEVPELLKRVMLHRRREEVLPDLPKKIWKDLIVEVPWECQEILDEVLEKIKAAGADFEAALGDASAARHGIVFEQMSRARSALATAKIPALLEQIEVFEDNNEPVVVFSYHRPPIDLLAQRPGWAVITGDTSSERRQEIVNEFQGGRLKGVAATIQAGGTGLTLTKANQAIFVDLAWTPALNKQAEDRICRIGQTRGVIITRLIASHLLDERVSELLMKKQLLIEGTIEKAAVVHAEIRGDQDLAALEKAHITDAPANLKASPAAGTGPRSEVQPQNGSGQPGGRRGPQNELERWAMNGLIGVAGMDPDHARARNDIGFSRLDQDFGHSLAKAAASGEATDKQWQWIVRMARKYRRQIGPEPQQEAV